MVLVSALASAAVPSLAAASVPVIQDDYARARAEANRRGLPIFVEVWAPW